MYFVDILERNKYNKNIAIVEDTGRKILYEQWYAASVCLSNQLLEKESNIMLYIGNKIEFAIGIFAIWMAGKTAVLLDRNLTAEEVKSIAIQSDSKTIMVSDGDECWFPELGVIKVSLQYAMNGKIKNLEYRNVNPVVVLLPTSGTMGGAKIVPLTDENMMVSVENVDWCLNGSVNAIVLLPLTSIVGLVHQLLYVMYKNMTLTLFTGMFNVKRIMKTVLREQIDHLILTPTMFSLFNDSNDFEASGRRNIKFVYLVGEKVNAEKLRIWRRKFSHIKILQGYGLTETTGAITAEQIILSGVGKGVGKSVPSVSIKIKEETGEILVKGKNVFQGYYNDIERSKDVFEGEWFRTGDIGYLDNEGYLHIQGRLKSIIIVGGKNVHVEEVEGCLERHPQIKRARAFREKDALRGELVAVEIESDGGMTKEQVVEYCKNKLSEYKIPKKFYFVEEITTNSNGKKIRG